MTALTLDAELPWQRQDQTGLVALKEKRDGPVPVAVMHRRVARIWVAQLNTATDADRLAIDAAHDETKGGALTLDWTPPGEASPIKVRFLPGQAGYRRRRASSRRWQIMIALEEALST